MVLILLGVALVASLVIGGENPGNPEISLRVETDKDVYLVGENVTITLYFVNNGSTEITLPSLSYYLEIRGPSGFVLGMAVEEMRYVGDPIIIPPSSERCIDSYVWGQIDTETRSQVPTGAYTIYVGLGYYALEGSKTIQIG